MELILLLLAASAVPLSIAAIVHFRDEIQPRRLAAKQREQDARILEQQEQHAREELAEILAARKVLQTMESEDLALEKDRLEVETMRLKTEKLRAKLNETQNSKNSDN